MFELITQVDADKVKKILTNIDLNEDINIEVLNGMFRLKADNITECFPSVHFNYDMSEFYLKSNESLSTLLYKDKLYEIFINIGNWAYDTPLKNTHITVGSNKFHDYSFQLELSQAFKDEENLYIVKNISNLSGKGAMVRLYRGLGSDRIAKESRREKFIKEFNADIKKFEGKEWIVISQISLKDLDDENKYEDILYNTLVSIIKAMLLVEGIGLQK